nr:phage tail tape measure protein [uncultured Mediterranean phage uvMED]
MGLLDTWNDWKKQTGYFENSSQNIEDQFKNADTSRATGSLDTAGGVTSSDPLKQVKTKSGQIKPVQTISRNTGINPNNIQKAMMSPNNTQSLAQSPEVKAATDPITTGGKGVKQAEDMGFMQKLSNMAGVNFDKAAANWKDKGGFEGLMANPAFSLGLALMQSSANGKTINQGILDNFVKSANISKEFKDRLAAKFDVVEVTEGQTNKIKDVLGTFGISAPKLRKILPGNQSESYEQAVEDIAFKVQNKINAMTKTAKKKGQKIQVGNTLYKKVIQDMIDSGEIDKKGGLTIGGYNIIDSTIEAPKREQGGPVQEGKPYVVGEKGPEIIIPRSDGNVLSNDDSQIYAMLLASNPQLQKVSRQRAEKILRNRFPEYFEG